MVAVSVLTNGNSTTDSVSTYTTASVSAEHDSLLVVSMGFCKSGGATIDLSDTGMGLTWTKQAARTASSSTSIQVWTAPVGSSDVSGTLTFTLSANGSQSAGWTVLQVTGQDATTPVLQAVTGNGNGADSHVTFSPAGNDDNRMLYFMCANSNISAVPYDDWLELEDNTIASPSFMMYSAWRPDAPDTTGGATLSSASFSYGAIGLEINTGPVIPSTVTYDEAVLEDSPSFYLEVHSDGTAKDAISGTALTVHSSPTLDVGPDGSPCLVFDGVDDWLEQADRDDLSYVTTGQFTVEMVMRPDVNNFPGAESSTDGPMVHFVGKGTNGGHQEWVCRMYDRDTGTRPNRISGYAFNTSGGMGAGSFFEDTVTAGDWIHYVFTINQTTGYTAIFKDGNQRDQDALADYSIVGGNENASMGIGSSNGTSFFQGALHKVAIYPTALSETQVRAHYAAVNNPGPSTITIPDSCGILIG